MESNHTKLPFKVETNAAGMCILITVVFVFLDIALSFSGGDVAVGGVLLLTWIICMGPEMVTRRCTQRRQGENLGMPVRAPATAGER